MLARAAVTAENPPLGLRRASARRASLSRALAEAGPMIWLTCVEGGARVLSFGFYLVSAHVFNPRGFGVVQYTITVGLLAFCALQVLTTALTRELGAARGDAEGIQAVLGSSLVVAGGLVLGTTLVCVLASSIGLTDGASSFGLIAVVVGTTAFQLYYAIARGLGDPSRQAASYAGASLAQLIVFAALAVLAHPSPTVALVVFGGSSFVPVLLYEWRRPVLRRHHLRVRREVVGRLWRLGAPLLIAQVGYLVWNSLDQLWVQGALGTFQIGLYAAAKNLSLVLIVIPAGVSGALLPRVSQLKASGNAYAARRLVLWGTVGAVVLSALVAAMIGSLRVPLLNHLYGHSYAGAAGALALLSLGMVCYAGFAALTMAAVGWGRPKVYTAGIALAAGLEALALVVLHGHGLQKAALAYSISMAGALLFVVALLCVKPLWTPGR